MGRRTIFWVFAMLGTITILDVAVLPTWWVVRDREVLASGPAPRTSYMRDAADHGLPAQEWRWTPLDSVSPWLACAVVLAEDEQFFRSHALAREKIQRQWNAAIRGDFSVGYSGIGQQLARNLYLTPARTPRRKAREYVVTMALHHLLSKDRALELHLNVAEWGLGRWGIAAASEAYLGMSPGALSPARAIVLASMLPAPRRELQYAVGDRAAPRQELTARKLWRASLLSDNGYGATIDRLRLWRARARAGASMQDAFAAVDSIMGPETVPPIVDDELPLSRACDTGRRP